jgi:hypothetical protein
MWGVARNISRVGFNCRSDGDKLARFDNQMEVKLQELLNHPAVQAGLAPFLVALITAELFQRMKLSGLAIIAGFAITVYLASNFTLEPAAPSPCHWQLLPDSRVA